MCSHYVDAAIPDDDRDSPSLDEHFYDEVPKPEPPCVDSPTVPRHRPSPALRQRLSEERQNSPCPGSPIIKPASRNVQFGHNVPLTPTSHNAPMSPSSHNVPKTPNTCSNVPVTPTGHHHNNNVPVTPTTPTATTTASTLNRGSVPLSKSSHNVHLPTIPPSSCTNHNVHTAHFATAPRIRHGMIGTRKFQRAGLLQEFMEKKVTEEKVTEEEVMDEVTEEVSRCGKVISPEERMGDESWNTVTEDEEDVVDSAPSPGNGTGRHGEKTSSRNSDKLYTDFEPFITRYFLQRFAQLDLST